MLCGCQSRQALTGWGKRQEKALLRAMGFPRGQAPGYGTLQRLVSGLNTAAFEATLFAWAHAVLKDQPGRAGWEGCISQKFTGESKLYRGESETGMNQEEVRTKLLAEATAAIDRMLEKAAGKRLKMREIVALALESGQQIETAIGGTLGQGSEAPEPTAPLCEQCGGVMHHKGRRRRDIVTEAGETRLERTYYYCAACKVGRFPPR